MENNGFIKQLVQHLAAVKENTIAFSLYDGSQVVNVTFQQFLSDILKAAGYFFCRKIKNQHIAIAAENSYDWLVAFFAITGSGNTAVLLNQDLPEDLLQRQCTQADVSIICSNTPRITEFGTDFRDVECLSFEKIKAGPPVSIDEISSSNPDDTIVMMFTSGTTGKSRIVELSSENLESSVYDTEVMSTPSLYSVLLCLPLFHIYGVVVAVACLQQRKTICIGRGMRYTLADMPVLNPSFVSLVPSVLDSMVRILGRVNTTEERQKYIGTNLVGISVGGAGVNLDSCQYMMNMGIMVQSVYGMTESTGSGTWCIWNEENIGSIGKPYGRTLCRIEDGELLLKGPPVMKGYYKDPEETAKIIENGWLHTGDLAYCDENGYYYLTGRKKNVIILSNGENVNPEEIEAQFSKCPEILECLVYSDKKGICADVYTINESAASDFIKKYNEEVPLYRQVRKVTYSPAPLEKTGSGKIKRKENTYV